LFAGRQAGEDGPRVRGPGFCLVSRSAAVFKVRGAEPRSGVVVRGAGCA
jgi:hypothetical protein